MIKPALQGRLRQQMALTPQLQDAIHLLQLSTLALNTQIQETLESNVMLEAQESSEHHHAKENAISYYESRCVPSLTKSPTYRDSTDQIIEKTHAPDMTLRDYLYWQMHLTAFTMQDKAIATVIIDSIAEDGFLSSTLEELLQCLSAHQDITLDDIEVVLHQIQNFDPSGVGARSLQECLLIQLRQLPNKKSLHEQAMHIIKEHMTLLGKQAHSDIMRQCQLSKDEFYQTMELIKSLNPRPGNAINPTQAACIVPDVIIKKQQGKWVAQLNEHTLPKLSINQRYAGYVQRANQSPDNVLLREHLQTARWFIKSLQSRQETLLKVANCIAQAQSAFFEYGEEAMNPLVLQYVADKVGLHESTVSRVTTQKYLLTPQGIFELKYFFSSHVATQGGGVCSSTAIRALIKRFIGQENHQKPLSDHKIAHLLVEQGICVARRTVAKYRESLHIPPSHERKGGV